MSSLYQLFRRKFSTATSAATGTASIKELSEDLYKERNLKRLVEKFKQFSNSDRFRTKAGMYESTVRRLASAKRFRWIEEILEYQKKFRYDLSNEGFSTRLITLYGKSGMFQNAHQMFDEMAGTNCIRTVKSLNALLGAYVNSGKFDQVEGLFRDLQEQLKIEPDVVSYNTVIKGLCELGELDRSILILDEMEMKGLKPDLISFNTILGAFYANNRFDDGEKIWNQMDEKEVVPNIRTYNARLVGLVNEKRVEEAAQLIDELGNKKLKADVFSYSTVIKGYCEDKNFDAAKRWYSKLIENDCIPHRALFEYLLSCASEKGDFSWAFLLCQDIFKFKSIVDVQLLQDIVNGLVNESKLEEAQQLLNLGKSNSYRKYELKVTLVNQ